MEAIVKFTDYGDGKVHVEIQPPYIRPDTSSPALILAMVVYDEAQRIARRLENAPEYIAQEG